jgi:hypothetical protein
VPPNFALFGIQVDRVNVDHSEGSRHGLAGGWPKGHKPECVLVSTASHDSPPVRSCWPSPSECPPACPLRASGGERTAKISADCFASRSLPAPTQPTESDPTPQIYRMRLFTKTPTAAKSRFW